MNETQLWQAVCDRDTTQNGRFFFAVRTTGIFCKPSCPARRPKRENVEFFATADAAEHAGYRACQRCHPWATVAPEPNLELMQAVCRAIENSPEAICAQSLSFAAHL